MNDNSKRIFQILIGLTILTGAVIVSYFSVSEIDPQSQPHYDIYLVTDVSGSMGTCLRGDTFSTCYEIGITDQSPIVFAKKAAVEFVNSFALNDASNHRIGLAIFHGSNNGENPISKIIVELDNNPQKLKDGIDSLFPGGGTAMGDGISTAAQSLVENSRPDSKKIIVLLSDGVSNIGVSPLSAAENANDNEITIFSVGYGSSADVQTLKAVSSLTNGKYYDAPTGQELAETFNEIADVLISPVSHYSSRILILIAIPVLLFIPIIEKSLTSIAQRKEKIPDRKPKSPKQQNQTTNHCTKCELPVNTDQKFCGKCGTLIKQNNLSQIKCNNCNSLIHSSSKFCGKCGISIRGGIN